MSFYEHTFVGKQDISEKDVNNLIDICTNIIKTGIITGDVTSKKGSTRQIYIIKTIQ